jgi:hypothetical protein
MRHIWMRFGLAAVTVAGTTAPASAFYWVGWPGANPVGPPTITVVEPLPERPKPGEVIVEPPPGPTDEPPKNVPEPATLVLAAIGASGLAVRWWKKRKKK